jgi:hypothetical protein
VTLQIGARDQPAHAVADEQQTLGAGFGQDGRDAPRQRLDEVVDAAVDRFEADRRHAPAGGFEAAAQPPPGGTRTTVAVHQQYRRTRAGPPGGLVGTACRRSGAIHQRSNGKISTKLSTQDAYSPSTMRTACPGERGGAGE